jgi:hypothetical protein
MVSGGIFTFVIVKSAPLSRRERVNATLETLKELQSLFCCVSNGGSMFDKLDDVRVVVEGMKRQ